MQLEDLIKDVQFDASKSLSKIEVESLSCDSRTVEKGALFFGLSGVVEDGMEYAEQAEQKGAVAVIHDSENKIDSSIPHIQVDDARAVMSQVACRFYENPSKRFYLCGVTGTNGKTTMTYLLDRFFDADQTGIIGTINVRYGDKVLKTSHTTPESLVTQKYFSEMAEAGTKVVVMEVSSHALAQKRVDYSDFDSAIFTNLTQDHLDYHSDMESYFQAKKRLFLDCLGKSSKKNKLAVVNLDSAYGRRLIEDLDGVEGVQLKTVSLKNKNADLHLLSSKIGFQGIEATLSVDGQECSFKTNLIGEHNISNVMQAMAVALHKGVALEKLLSDLESMVIPGRLESVGARSIFVDYAHTPDALENVISALNGIRKSGRLIVVFGCGGDRDQAKRPLMGEVVGKNSDVAFVTSDNPRTEDPRDIIDQILDGVVGYQSRYDGEQGYCMAVDREEAIEEAVSLMREDDVLLVAGKGHEDYQIIGKEKRYFDDREILQSLLK